MTRKKSSGKPAVQQTREHDLLKEIEFLRGQMEAKEAPKKTEEASASEVVEDAAKLFTSMLRLY